MIEFILNKTNRRSFVYRFNDAIKNVKENNSVLNQEAINFIYDEYSSLKEKVGIMRKLIMLSMSLPLSVIVVVCSTRVYNIFLSMIVIVISSSFLCLMIDMLLLLKREIEESEEIISSLK